MRNCIECINLVKKKHHNRKLKYEYSESESESNSSSSSEENEDDGFDINNDYPENKKINKKNSH